MLRFHDTASVVRPKILCGQFVCTFLFFREIFKAESSGGDPWYPTVPYHMVCSPCNFRKYSSYFLVFFIIVRLPCGLAHTIINLQAGTVQKVSLLDGPIIILGLVQLIMCNCFSLMLSCNFVRRGMPYGSLRFFSRHCCKSDNILLCLLSVNVSAFNPSKV
jgi:hypothetical protein